MPPQEKAKAAANTTKTTGTPDEARSRPTKRVSRGAMMPKTSTTPTPRARKMPHNTAPTLFLTTPSYQAVPERRVAGFTRGVVVDLTAGARCEELVHGPAGFVPAGL